LWPIAKSTAFDRNPELIWPASLWAGAALTTTLASHGQGNEFLRYLRNQLSRHGREEFSTNLDKLVSHFLDTMVVCGLWESCLQRPCSNFHRCPYRNYDVPSLVAYRIDALLLAAVVALMQRVTTPSVICRTPTSLHLMTKCQS
jgi:hypothetical protein